MATVSREYPVTDFDAVEIGSAIRGEVVRGDAFSVSITADDDIIDQVVAEKWGTVLRVYVTFRLNFNWLFGRSRIECRVTLPDLKAAAASGAARVNVTGFHLGHDLELEASGAGTISGDAVATSVRATLSGASKLSLAGEANELKLLASGASNADLANFQAGQTSVDLSGASAATVVAREALDYEVSGASHLSFRGQPRIGRASSSGASSVISG